MLCQAALPAAAANYTLSAPDVIDESSFAEAGSWSSALAPSAGNNYYVNILQLRTPPDGESHVFGGDRLVLQEGGMLMYKGVGATGVITVGDLLLAGGTIDHRNGVADLFILAGAVEVSTDSVVDALQGEIRIESEVSGDAVLTVASSGGNGYPVTLAGSVELESNLEVSGLLVLDEAGSYHFDLPTTGMANTITGTGAVDLNGTLVLDLEGTGFIGRYWTLVDAATLTLTHGENFAIEGFTENDGYWTDAAREYRYSEATGVVTRISGDSDGDGFPDSWEQQNFGNLGESASGDPDFDGSSNRLEFEEGTDPSDRDDFPDSDGDGMSDGWELAYFGSLDALPGDDSDNDFNTNLEEFLADTNPVSEASFPDFDDGGAGDGINDGWEVNYFGSIEDCDPAADDDGDLYSNIEEFLGGTDPLVQASSPDGDGDGLPDGWEVLHFGEEGEDLLTVTEKFAGIDDPDGDGYVNLIEFQTTTDPNDSEDVPGPLAWWRFEEATEGAVPGDEGGGAYIEVVEDSSGSGNPMRTWNDQTAPEYTTDVPFDSVPVGGQTNTASLYFDAGADGTWSDTIWTEVGPLRSQPLTRWTIEASFKMDEAVTGGNQAIFSKDGNPLATLPMFHLKYLVASGTFEVGLIDGSGTARYLESESAIEAGAWYSVAATADEETLSLWIKHPGDSNYTLEGTLAIEGAFYNSFSGFNDAWAFGRARWNGGETDWFKGWIDEVRVSGGVLPASEFLASDGTVDGDSDLDGMPDDWELANFGNLDQKPEDDFDGDSTSNLAEHVLGLDPKDPMSRFAATMAGEGSLEWPSASGVDFTVERSQVLGDDWQPVGTVPGVDGLQSWSDPEAPEMRAFYRVSFPE